MVSNQIFGVFWLFLAILIPRRSQSAISPLGLRGHRSNKKLIGHHFHAFMDGFKPNFWRFLAIFGYFDPEKVTIRHFTPGFGGSKE